MIWARDWAQVGSFEDRFDEVGAEQLRRFGRRDHIYFHYRWLSSAVHAGPLSVAECLEVSSDRLAARKQPERQPTAGMAVATVTLADTCILAAADLDVPFRSEVAALKAELQSRGAG